VVSPNRGPVVIVDLHRDCQPGLIRLDEQYRFLPMSSFQRRISLRRNKLDSTFMEVYGK